MGNSGDGKRKLKRAPFNNHVMVNRVMRFRATDIGEGGIYVHTGRSFPPSSIVDIAFVLNNITYNLSAIVQHNEAGIGMGLMFRNLNDKERDRIKAYVNEMCKVVKEKKKIVMIYDLIPLTMQKRALVNKGYAVNEINVSHRFLSTAIEQSPMDMIILILNLTSVQESEVVQLLSGCEAFGCVPVLLISDNRATEVVNRIIDAGASGFIPRATAAPKKVVDMVEEVFKKISGCT
jgi:AmiR/NasT family two-component response regulator